MILLQIKTPADFSFQECYKYLEKQEKECLFHCEENIVFRALRVESKTIFFRVYFDEEIRVEIENDDSSLLEQKEISDFVRIWFGLDYNLDSFYNLAQTDKILSSLVHKYKGLRIMALPDLFECLCWAIIGQQINLSFAHSVKRQFIEKYGRVESLNNRSYYVFPKAEDIIDLSIDELKSVQLSKQKAMYILNVAAATIEGRLNREKLLLLSNTEIEKVLISIKGIGKWTAHYAMMKNFQDFSAFPIQDVGLHNAIREQLKMHRKPSYTELEKLSENWGEWKAYATFYLWRTLY